MQAAVDSNISYYELDHISCINKNFNSIQFMQMKFYKWMSAYTLDLDEEQFNHWLMGMKFKNNLHQEWTTIANKEIDFTRITVAEKRQIECLNKYPLYRISKLSRTIVVQLPSYRYNGLDEISLRTYSLQQIMSNDQMHVCRPT